MLARVSRLALERHPSKADVQANCGSETLFILLINLPIMGDIAMEFCSYV